MDNITEWSGSQIPQYVEQGDESSISATIVYKDQDTLEVYTKSADFEVVEGNDAKVADLTLEATGEAGEMTTSVVGVFEYQIYENFEDESPFIYPNPDGCGEDECELPTLTICEALDEETS